MYSGVSEGRVPRYIEKDVLLASQMLEASEKALKVDPEAVEPVLRMYKEASSDNARLITQVSF
jgi:hypothetical protein